MGFFNDMQNISYCTVSFRQYLIKLHCTHTFQGSTIEIGEREIKRIYLYWYIIIIFHSENRTKTNFFLYSKVTQNTSYFFQCYYPGMLPWKIFVDIIFFVAVYQNLINRRERVEIFKRIKISLEHLDITICTKCSMSDLHSTHQVCSNTMIVCYPNTTILSLQIPISYFQRDVILN